MPDRDDNAMHFLNPDTLKEEDSFRYLVRDALGLDWATRDDKIFEELKRLKSLDDTKRSGSDTKRSGSDTKRG